MDGLWRYNARYIFRFVDGLLWHPVASSGTGFAPLLAESILDAECRPVREGASTG